jgi:hypothetical protein
MNAAAAGWQAAAWNTPLPPGLATRSHPNGHRPPRLYRTEALHRGPGLHHRRAEPRRRTRQPGIDPPVSRRRLNAAVEASDCRSGGRYAFEWVMKKARVRHVGILRITHAGYRFRFAPEVVAVTVGVPPRCRFWITEQDASLPQVD